VRIFTKYTSSDIKTPAAALDVIKLFIAARNEPVKEIHFPGTLGPSFVYATRGQIEQAVSQFLGIEGTNGPRGTTTAGGRNGVPAAQAAAARRGKKAAKAGRKAAKGSGGSGRASPGLTVTKLGRSYAQRVHHAYPPFPVYYPSTVAAGSSFPERVHYYNLADPGLKQNERFSYRFVLKTPTGDYYGLQGLSWKDPPILKETHETRTIGDRTYNIYYDNNRIRLISWSTDKGVYWVSNSLLESLSQSQMIAIARGAKLIPGQ
jgi:polyisoprenyl-teichoic acid--peptidoglycan teichoic acid transferase